MVTFLLVAAAVFALAIFPALVRGVLKDDEKSTGREIVKDTRPGDIDDDGYEKFVEEMWRRPGVQLGGVKASTAISGLPVECSLVSLVTAENGTSYLNAIVDGERKTYAADGRHDWKIAGRTVDSSAFFAIAQGVSVAEVLRPSSYPQSVAEALDPKNDHGPHDRFRRFVICYVNRNEQRSYRVISQVVRQRDTFSARCHFRWGQRRTFLFEGLERDEFRLSRFWIPKSGLF